MLERAGSDLAEVTQQSAVGVGQLKERDVRHETEGLLYDIHERIGKEQEHAVHGKMDVHLLIHLHEVVVLHHLQRQVDNG